MRRQTHTSLLLKERYEASRLLSMGDDQAFCEELGDMLPQRRAGRAEAPNELAYPEDDLAYAESADPGENFGRELFRLGREGS